MITQRFTILENAQKPFYVPRLKLTCRQPAVSKPALRDGYREKHEKEINK